MLSEFIRQEFTRNAVQQAGGAGGDAGAEALQARVDHRRYNGAALLGLRGLVFKSHGSADAFAFEHALARAYDAARNRLLDRVHDRIRETLQALPIAGRCRAGTVRMTSLVRSRMPRYSRITGTGSHLPPRRLSNDDMARELAAQAASRPRDDWIVERTGIRARHFAADGVALQRPGAAAAQRALSRRPARSAAGST